MMTTHEKAVEVCQKLKLPTSGPAYVLIQSALDDFENQYSERIAELEAQQWQPVTQYVLARDKTDPKTKISILAGGQTFSLRLSSGQAEFFIELTDDIRLCRKVQAAQVVPSAQKGKAE